MAFVRNHILLFNGIASLLFALLAAFKGHKIPEGFKQNYNALSVHAQLIIDYIPIALIGLGLIILLLYILEYYETKSLKIQKEKLEKERDKFRAIAENVGNLFQGYLYQLSTLLEFGSQQENNERITLYVHDGNGHFVPIGRYSSNPNYRTPSRNRYPDNEGLISRAWENGWVFDNRFPCKTLKRGDWIDYHLELGIKRNTAKKFNMPSTLYAIKRIDDINGNSVALLAVESTFSDRYKENNLKDIMLHQERYLCELVTKLRDYIPSPDVAIGKGL